MYDKRIAIHRVRESQRRARPADESKLGFGRYFSDHFFATEFDRVNGWHLTRIEPMRPLKLDPAALCLHYGQEVFEGLKARRGRDGGVYLFRWQENARRMRHSCVRLMMEPVDEEFFGRAVKALVLIDRDWIPRDPDCSLYIRPTVIATDPVLGVRPGDEYAFYVIVGPVGAYWPQGFQPVRIRVSEEDVRAVRGGLGDAKTAANYAHSLHAQKKATDAGYSQVLWLDALEHRWVEEVGTMNVFFLLDEGLVTPPLAGTILPGVTRDSVIQIARKWDVKVVERPISIDEVMERTLGGTLKEAFGTGTAACIAPIGALSYKGRDVMVNGNRTGALAGRLFEYVSRLQRGEEKDEWGWVERIDRLDLTALAAFED